MGVTQKRENPIEIDTSLTTHRTGSLASDMNANVCAFNRPGEGSKVSPVYIVLRVTKLLERLITESETENSRGEYVIRVGPTRRGHEEERVPPTSIRISFRVRLSDASLAVSNGWP